MSKSKKKGRFAPKLHVKKGDTVEVISGASKGARGEILEVIPSKNRAIVDGVNLAKKHQKPTQENAGGIIEIPLSIHVSNLMVIDPKSGEPSRIGRKEFDGKLERYSKKSGEIIK